jgi:DtxR family transcriptional regulator, Mn-dependent transcriptional regulator
MTLSEENYIKTIYHLTAQHGASASTNAIAEKMETKAASVTDMLRKLAEKQLISYQKYQGVLLTDLGYMEAKMIVRKHRLWEVFLVDKLDFAWHEVHDIAEQLEHIRSDKLVDKLDAFLGHPQTDPHGDPIPDAKGLIRQVDKEILALLDPGTSCVCVGVKDSSTEFLQYLDRRSISLGSKITVLSREAFDDSLHLSIEGNLVDISSKTASNLYVKIE